MRIPILLFMIASIILLSVHFWANWDSYFFHPEEDDFHPEEPAAEFFEGQC
jgi:hypothetical protein